MLDDEPKMANIGTLVNPVTLSWNVPLTLQVIPFFFFNPSGHRKCSFGPLLSLQGTLSYSLARMPKINLISLPLTTIRKLVFQSYQKASKSVYRNLREGQSSLFNSGQVL